MFFTNINIIKENVYEFSNKTFWNIKYVLGDDESLLL